jgi:hypothetical protein
MDENANSIRDIPLSTIGGIKLIAVWKQSKDRRYVVKSENEKNTIKAFTQHQFHEALQNGNRLQTWSTNQLVKRIW